MSNKDVRRKMGDLNGKGFFCEDSEFSGRFGRNESR